MVLTHTLNSVADMDAELRAICHHTVQMEDFR